MGLLPTGVRALLFDVDGTLVDSNYLHVDAWQRAFRRCGLDVDAWRIHRAIGEDSARLIAGLGGEEHADALRELHATFYAESADRLRPFERARDLLRELHVRGLRAVLATSAPQEELSMLLDALDASEFLHATTSADDVEEAKPDPGIVRVALERAGVAADEAVFIGDSVWDMQAAGRAGVIAFGLRSGGVSDAELRAAGASAVFDDPADLLDELRR